MPNSTHLMSTPMSLNTEELSGRSRLKYLPGRGRNNTVFSQKVSRLDQFSEFSRQFFSWQKKFLTKSSAFANFEKVFLQSLNSLLSSVLFMHFAAGGISKFPNFHISEFTNFQISKV